MEFDLGRSSDRHLDMAAGAILESRRGRGDSPAVAEAAEDARAALVAVRLPQIALALDDAVRLIRAWHGMGMSKGEHAPEMKSIMLALKAARGDL